MDHDDWPRLGPKRIVRKEANGLTGMMWTGVIRGEIGKVGQKHHACSIVPVSSPVQCNEVKS